MLSRRKRELLFNKGGGGVNEEGEEENDGGGCGGGTTSSNNEDSGLVSTEGDSPSATTKVPENGPQKQPTAKNTTAALMNEQQWAQLNEQIKQICLDCSKQFGENGQKATTTMRQEKPAPLVANKTHQPAKCHQTLQLPPNPKKATTTFSLPRLFLPKGKQKRQQPEQHSPTTTSAYGTGGTDTGQESPVERQQQKGGGGGEEKEKVAGGKQKSVKFDPSIFAPSQHAAVGQLPGGIFYTSAERLAQTLEAQQRLLKRELEEESPGGRKQQQIAAILQRQQPLDKEKRPLIRVPMASPLCPSAAMAQHGCGTTTAVSSLPLPPPHTPQNAIRASPFAHPRPPPPVNLIVRNASTDAMVSPTAQQKLSRPTSMRQVVPPNSPQSTAMRAPEQPQPNPIRPTRIEWARGPQMHLKPTLDNIFAYKPSPQMRREDGEEAGGKGGPAKMVVMVQQHQQRRKSRSPQKQQQAELEWVVKRRPDGTRYVTRRPVRKAKQQCWSAMVKARREQSLLRERHQSGAASTTDDDGTNVVGGNELGSRHWMREQRGRHKGGRGEEREGGQWTTMATEQSGTDHNYGGQREQVLPRLNTFLRLDSTRVDGGGGAGGVPPVYCPQRGHSLPGQGLFSVTTV